MKMDQVAGSGNDEFYTPAYAITPILKYLAPGSTVWCPFDTEQSIFVKMLHDAGHRVIYSHLSSGHDFFNTHVECDYVISNPPYSLKAEVLISLFLRGMPFAMLVGVVGLFESNNRFTLFQQNKFEMMYFDKRISYLKSYDDDKPALNPPFSSVYVCSKVLPQQIVFERVDKTKIKP